MRAGRIRATAALVVLVVLAVTAEYEILTALRKGRGCRENLRAIGQAVNRYQERWGHLPVLPFHPQEGMDGPTLESVLGRYGLPRFPLRCPGSRLVGAGPTHYVWNSAWNGRTPHPQAPVDWLVIEVEAVSARVPRPHLFYYQALFTDGTVRLLRVPPDDLAPAPPAAPPT